MELKNIEVGKIVPNTYNPNVVSEHLMTQLKKSIERKGFLQPLILRPHPTEAGKYEIIDGEHRFKVLTEGLHYKEIPCVVIESDDNMAKIETINMNKLRGEFDSIKLAEVIVDLRKTYSDEELTDLLGYTSEELTSFDELINFDFEKLSEEDLPESAFEEENLDLPQEFTVTLDYGQMDMVETALSQAEMDRPEALTAICKEYLEKHAPEKIGEVAERIKNWKKSGEKDDATEKDEKAEGMEEPA